MCDAILICWFCFFFSSRRRHTRCALVTGVQTCALPIYEPVKSASAKKESPLVPRDGKGQSKFDVPGRRIDRRNIAPDEAESGATRADDAGEIGRASCRERVGQYV